MQVPLQITFRGMSPSPALEALVRQRSTRLERFNGSIIRCHVVIDVPHRHSRKGRDFTVHLDITTPLGEIAVTRNASRDTHPDLQSTIRDAFDVATRRLEEEARRRRAA